MIIIYDRCYSKSVVAYNFAHLPFTRLKDTLRRYHIASLILTNKIYKLFYEISNQSNDTTALAIMDAAVIMSRPL